VQGLRGAAFDEIQLGAEGSPGAGVRLLLRGSHRTQRDGIVGVLSPASGQAVYGNPGHGELAAYPEVSRIYQALEFTAERRGASGSVVGASYVVSSLEGNYEGYWDQSAGVNDPLGGAAFVPEPGAATFSDGPLPNDRRHQLKGYATHDLWFGMSAG